MTNEQKIVGNYVSYLNGTERTLEYSTYCPMDENVADLFMKALARLHFQKLRGMMNLGPAHGGSVGISGVRHSSETVTIM